MTAASVVVLEPGKLGRQHITLIEAYLTALLSLDLADRGVRPVYAAHPTSWAALPDAVRAGLSHRPVEVIDAGARRWIAKALLEVRTVWTAIRQLGPRDLLLVLGVTAPTLMLLELTERLIGRRRVVVVLHAEVEALFDPGLRSPRTWGFWAYRWSRLRRRDSRLRLAVIADWIRGALARLDHPAFAPDEVVALTLPAAPVDAVADDAVPPRVAFIGYKTRMKGFDVALRTAARLAGPDLAFAVVGDGGLEALPSGERHPYGPGGFAGEVGRSAVALFPYDRGYDASMSAAALDAIAAGVHMVATPRGCFAAVRRELGDDAITLFDSEDELAARLSDPAFIARAAANKAARRARLAASAFSPAATRDDFARLLDAYGLTVAGALAA